MLFKRTVLIIVAVTLLSSAVQAEPIQAGTATYAYDNSFITRLFPGTPFNQGNEPVDLPVVSVGVFTQVWEAQVGDEIVDELTGLRQSGVLPTDPVIPFEIFGGVNEAPFLDPFVGTISNIVQDASDPGFLTGDPSSLVGGVRRVGGPFAQQLADGTLLYTDASYFFEAKITGLPFPVGQQFIGTEDVAIRVQLGATIDPATDPIVGMALAGGLVEITAVPEPDSGMLLFSLCLSLLGMRRRVINAREARRDAIFACKRQLPVVSNTRSIRASSIESSVCESRFVECS